MEQSKAMTLRLPLAQAQQLEKVAAADDASVSDVVRQAIEAHIEARRRDPDFQERLERLVQENQAIFDLLSQRQPGAQKRENSTKN